MHIKFDQVLALKLFVWRYADELLETLCVVILLMRVYTNQNEGLYISVPFKKVSVLSSFQITSSPF